MKEKTFGKWESPITAAMAASSLNRYAQIKVHNHKVYWLEQRPSEKGRSVVVCFDGKKTVDITPADVNVHSGVHEYGGGEFTIGDAGVYYIDGKDQCIYLASNNKIERVTTLPEVEGSVRYADPCLTPDEKYLICVRERHTEEGVINDLVVLPSMQVLASGADFYMFPCISPNGKKIAWVQWNLPQMPWDGTELWRADFENGEAKNPKKIAGGSEESICQPKFSPNNELVYISDRSGWWNLYKGETNLAPINAECAYPPWIFGTNTYAFIDESKIAVVATENGVQKFGVIENGKFTPLETSYDCIEPYVAVDGDAVCFVGSSSSEPAEICISTAGKSPRRIKAPIPFSKWDVDLKKFVSTPKSITFKTADNQTAYAFYYAPKNPDFKAPENTKPPLLVLGHGGPTSATSTGLDYKIQFWTSRGFAVIDVNYRGSTGYGRAYRNLLRKNWGKVDVEDCIHAAQYCIDNNLCNENQIFIRGKSASGLTTLLCMENSDLFAAGAVYYGVADLKLLLDDTHKFESRYTISLVGDYPKDKAIYEERSALKNIDKLSSPVIVFQGLLDKVVSPEQSEAIVAALKKKNIPVEYITFEDEGHGFRNAKNVKTALLAELEFYRLKLDD